MIKGVWKLNGNSNDFSGNSNNGTDSNINYVAGRYGQGASFNGSSSLITVTTNAGLQSSTFTVLAWVKLTDLANYNTIFGAASAGAPQFRHDQTNGKLALNKENVVGVFIGGISHTTAGKWAHVAVTSTATDHKGFYNGYQEVTSTSSVSWSWSNILFGKNGAQGGEWMKGVMDKIEWHNAVLSNQEIKTLFMANSGMF